ncbi:helix-turn-helix domain-containing protein [Nocardia sp. CS682]|uniref:helix-turn-helix domain-containing protein n=1 Tax=Nocardia sp. CS682 TaxID=1047172 RepID=UPI001075323D|nr:helix-turn-helix transcriptional regulator [Nocardia sp. CS682]QBS43586.1 hypothetical protein DMB37_29245 [Nocardia sp. CS682]
MGGADEVRGSIDPALLRAANSVEQFGMLVNAAIRIRGTSLRQLSEQTEIPRGLIASYMRGVSLPSATRLMPLLEALDVKDIGEWVDAHARIVGRRRPVQNVVVGGNQQINIIEQVGATSQASGETLAEKRQAIYFRFLGHSILQANIAFLLAMVFTAAGAGVTIWGAVMLLTHAGDPNLDYTPVVATLSGLVVAGGGGAFALHAYKARTHVTERADQVREDIQSDVAFERATSLIDRVQDSDLKDHLLSLTAVKELGLSPTPIDLTKHLPTKRIESQRLEEIERGEQS